MVVGAGPAGCAASTTAARAGLSVVLIAGCGGHGAFAVGEGAPPGLRQAVGDVFGPDAFVPDDHVRSVGNRASWGSAELLGTDFMFNPFGTGWHLDRPAFDSSLRAAAEAAGVQLRTSLDGDPETLAPTVVDATGRRADLARRRGARRTTCDRLIAVVAIYRRSDADSDATTTVETAETGWWYTCPVPHDRRVVAFLTDGDLLTPAMRTNDGFDRAGRATAHIAALLPNSTPRALRVTAAGTAHLVSPCGDGWLAVGDAAASFDPLSSQGILTAVTMGREAVRCLDDPGSFAARYEAIVARHAAECRTFYGLEDRWPTAPFWSRRRPT